jgi:prophage regulatory protein
MRVLLHEDLRLQKGIPYSKAHIWRLERDNKFPRRIRMGASRHGWLEEEIDGWLAARAAARDEEVA